MPTKTAVKKVGVKVKKVVSAAAPRSTKPTVAVLQHPSMKMVASKGITQGQPLKHLLSSKTVELIAEAFDQVSKDFNKQAFIANASKGLDGLELTPRSAQIGAALNAELLKGSTKKTDVKKAISTFVKALGPKSVDRPKDCATDGLGSFFYHPFGSFLAELGKDETIDMDLLLDANKELTQRFTAEFSVRSLILRDSDKVVGTFTKWCKDPSTDVRRLVSEGTRPRLPWGTHIPAFKKDPTPILPLLETLKDDEELYVRRSVANSVGDIAKDNMDVALTLCGQWMDQAKKEQKGPNAEAAKELRWVVRHALRNPIKNNNKKATAICNRWDK